MQTTRGEEWRDMVQMMHSMAKVRSARAHNSRLQPIGNDAAVHATWTLQSQNRRLSARRAAVTSYHHPDHGAGPVRQVRHLAPGS